MVTLYHLLTIFNALANIEQYIVTVFINIVNSS